MFYGRVKGCKQEERRKNEVLIREQHQNNRLLEGNDVSMSC